ncbi:hypothetical protein DFH07DRAFT_811694 [Mycena maculata]|uniref:F-box domain-containing protein n=1 Tax=Mycena maculata TaxID=230809 RepID=A0AAD7NJK5_9AGAR|nr:hypothetical protein DFH07DRAFT_811694 [Mycena maculata]
MTGHRLAGYPERRPRRRRLRHSEIPIPARMMFQDLPEDILRSVFSSCDVYAVLAVGRMNKYLHRLSRERLIWVNLVENLRRSGFIDQLSFSDIQSQSPEALVTLVKGLLTGPASWTPKKLKTSFITRFIPWSSHQAHSRAEISRQFIVHSQADRWNSPQLLAGGEYVLFKNLTLECWSVRQDKLVWSYETNGPNSFVFVTVFGAQVIAGGEQANILVCERVGTAGDGDFHSSVQIVNLDFETGVSTSLLSDLYQDDKYFTDAQVCGNVACLRLREYGREDGNEAWPFKDYCILMDWQTGSHLKLAANISATSLLARLLPNHVLFLADDRSGCPEISLFNTTAFSRHWRRTASQSPLDTLYVSDLEAVTRESVTLGADAPLYPWYRDLCAHASPVEEGTFRVRVQLAGFDLRWHAVAYRYRLRLPNAMRPGVVWQRLEAQRADHMSALLGTSYAGHKLRLYRYRDGRQSVYTVTHPRDPSYAVAFNLPDDTPAPHVSTYTGALTYYAPSHNSVVVAYFK